MVWRFSAYFAFMHLQKCKQNQMEQKIPQRCHKKEFDSKIIFFLLLLFNPNVVVNVIEVHQQTKIWIHHHRLIEVINRLFAVRTTQVHQNRHHFRRSPVKWVSMSWILVTQTYRIQWHHLWHRAQP